MEPVTTAAATGMSPWLVGGAIGANVLSGLFGGGGGKQQAGNLHLVNPAQQALYGNMAQGLMRGGGDFGLGSGIKQGSSQLAQMMAARGISPQSGAYAGAYGNMVGGAMSNDVAARRQYALSLLGTPLQTAQTAGANFIPGSPSSGQSMDAQGASWNRLQQTGFTPSMIGGYRAGAQSYAPDAYGFGGAPSGGSLVDRTRAAIQAGQRARGY